MHNMKLVHSLMPLLALATFAATSRREGVATLSSAVALKEDGSPPTEFRIFRAGVNSSDQGPVLFDAVAAERTMSAYREHGIAPIVDLEHLSLENPETSANYDPDARGSFDLELRNGELWAVNVKWTDDGRERLMSRRQRYFSPAIIREGGDDGVKRVVHLVNVALCSQPSLDHIEPLMAAKSTPAKRQPAAAPVMMLDATSGEDLAAIAEAFGLDASASLADVVQAAAAFVKEFEDAVNGSPPPAPGEGDNPSGEPGYEAGADAAAMRRRFAEKIVVRFGRAARAAQKKAPTDRALGAFRSTVLRETNATTSEEATEILSRWKSSHLTLNNERARMAEERAAFELRDKHDLVVELTKLGALTPAQAWAKDGDGIPQGPDEKKGKLGKLSALASKMTVAELRELRDDSKKTGRTQIAGGGNSPTTPPSVNHTAVEVTLLNGTKRVVELSEREVSATKKRLGAKASDDEIKAALAKYATLKANTELKSGRKAS